MSEEPFSENIPSFARECLEAFDLAAAKAIDPPTRELQRLVAPPMVYHYTGDAGLHGILRNGNLWFTHIFDLNDPSELRHGYSRASRILAERAAVETAAPQLRLLSKMVGMLGDEGLGALADYFVCSFSSDCDDLGQWRAYADNGRGFALGFDGLALQRRWVESPSQMSFAIRYDEAELLELHEWIVDRGASLLDLLDDPRWARTSEGKPDMSIHSPAREYMRELASIIAVHAVRAALFLKHRSYQNEQEYRLLVSFWRGKKGGPPVLHRTRPYSLVRYREYEWRAAAPGVLKKIIVGPAADDRALEFVRDNLREFHQGDVEVVRSEIPYRVR